MRKTLQIKIEAPGRDQGKTYLLREMPTRQSEWWGSRVLSAMARSGAEIPDDIVNAGLAGVASVGIKCVLSAAGMPEVKPLLDEMFDSCVAIIPDPMRPAIYRGPGGVGAIIDDDIEEISTLLRLRREVLMLHLDFLPPAARLILEMLLGAAGPITQNTSTSLVPSES